MMGQAKARGSYELRKAEGEEKQRLAEARRIEEARAFRLAEQKRIDSMHPEDRRKSLSDRATFLAMMAVVVGVDLELRP